MYTRVVRQLVMLQAWAWAKLMGLENKSPPDPDEEQFVADGQLDTDSEPSAAEDE
jgi:hypothetical protein